MTTLLGVDIGGTKIAVALVDAKSGRVLDKARVPTEAHNGGGPAVLQRALELAAQLAARADPPVRAIGIGAGGRIDPQTGVVVQASEILPGWTGTRLKAAFENAFQVPVAVYNDVNALASGEMRWGAGRGYRHALFLGLGTGVGGALVHHGEIVQGPGGMGGELGHLILFPDGLPCTCGRRGCLEQYTNGASLARYFHAAGGDPKRDSPAIANLARQGDPTAAQAARMLGEMLGLGLATLVNIWGPEAILLGGGVVDGLGDLLLAPARDTLAARVLPGQENVPLLTAALGPDAPVIGAASRAIVRLAEDVGEV